MDEKRVRNNLQKLIDGCGRAIRDAEERCRERPDQPPIDVEWFRVLRAKARTCLEALNAGNMEEVEALVGHIAAARDAPLWPSLARVLGLRPSDDCLGQPVPEPSSSPDAQQTLIHCDQLAKDWFYVHAENPPADPSRLPHLLNHAFTRWLKQNPNLKVRATLPILAAGNTLAIHVFCD